MSQYCKSCVGINQDICSKYIESSNKFLSNLCADCFHEKSAHSMNELPTKKKVVNYKKPKKRITKIKTKANSNSYYENDTGDEILSSRKSSKEDKLRKLNKLKKEAQMLEEELDMKPVKIISSPYENIKIKNPNIESLKDNDPSPIKKMSRNSIHGDKFTRSSKETPLHGTLRSNNLQISSLEKGRSMTSKLPNKNTQDDSPMVDLKQDLSSSINFSETNTIDVTFDDEIKINKKKVIDNDDNNDRHDDDNDHDANDKKKMSDYDKLSNFIDEIPVTPVNTKPKKSSNSVMNDDNSFISESIDDSSVNSDKPKKRRSKLVKKVMKKGSTLKKPISSSSVVAVNSSPMVGTNDIMMSTPRMKLNVKSITPKELKASILIQKHVRAFICFSKYSRTKARFRTIHEIVSSEQKYTQDLGIVVKHFLEPLTISLEQKKPILAQKDIEAIFVNIESLYISQKMFYNKLHRRASTLWSAQNIADVYLDFVDLEEYYEEFVVKYKGDRIIAEEMEKKTSFSSFIHKMQTSHHCKKLLLQAFLIQPIQRLPKLILLFEELLKKTDEYNKEIKTIKKVITMLKTMTYEINEKKRKYDRDYELIEFRKQLEEDLLTPELLDPSLKVVFHCFVGERVLGLKKTTSKKTMSLIVCDQLLIARNKKGKKLLWVSQLNNTQIIASIKDVIEGSKQKKLPLFEALANENSSQDLLILSSNNRVKNYPFIQSNYRVLVPYDSRDVEAFNQMKEILKKVVSLRSAKISGQFSLDLNVIENSLTNEEWNNLLDGVPEATFNEGNTIIEQDNGFKFIGLIKSGLVKVDQDLNNGKNNTITLCTMKKGEVFGEISFLLKSETTASVIAIEKTVVYTFDSPTLENIFKNKPALFKKFFQLLSLNLQFMIKERNLQKGLNTFVTEEANSLQNLFLKQVKQVKNFQVLTKKTKRQSLVQQNLVKKITFNNNSFSDKIREENGNDRIVNIDNYPIRIDKMLQTDKQPYSKYKGHYNCSYYVTKKAIIPGILFIFEDYMIFYTNPYQLDITVWILLNNLTAVSLSSNKLVLVSPQKTYELVLNNNNGDDQIYKDISSLHKKYQERNQDQDKKTNNVPASNVVTYDFTDINKPRWYSLLEYVEVVVLNKGEKIVESFVTKPAFFSVMRGSCYTQPSANNETSSPIKNVTNGMVSKEDIKNEVFNRFVFDRNNPLFGEDSYINGGFNYDVVVDGSFAQFLVLKKEKIHQNFSDDDELICKLFKFAASNLASKVLHIESKQISSFNLQVFGRNNQFEDD